MSRNRGRRIQEQDPFVNEVGKFAAGKRTWDGRIKKAGAIIVGDKDLICNNEPAEENNTTCGNLGNLLISV